MLNISHVFILVLLVLEHSARQDACKASQQHWGVDEQTCHTEVAHQTYTQSRTMPPILQDSVTCLTM